MGEKEPLTKLNNLAQDASSLTLEALEEAWKECVCNSSEHLKHSFMAVWSLGNLLPNDEQKTLASSILYILERYFQPFKDAPWEGENHA